MKKGYIHVYTGNGKGKTTASFGLAMRACGAGLKVYIGQFFKSDNYSEIKFLKKCNHDIVIEQFGDKTYEGKPVSQKDKESVDKGFKRVKEVLLRSDFDLVILDEINIALDLGLLLAEDVIDVLCKRKPTCEVVLTGRGAPEEIIKAADLVSEITEKKHYYQKGVSARIGIEK